MKRKTDSKQSRANAEPGGSMYIKWGKGGGSHAVGQPGSSSDPLGPEEDLDDEFPVISAKERGAADDGPRSGSGRSGTFDNEVHTVPRAVLAGCNTGMNADKYQRSIDELRGLAKACGLDPVSTVLQNADSITHATYMGSGKVASLKQEVEARNADIVLFNEALTPMQMRNLEKILDTEVLDRTGLILQIFASRARTREARLQVESAQLQYMLPRLVGMRAELSRQGGGSGRLSNKGAGEQKLELDRRRIEHRIAELGRELEVVSRERATQRSRRMQTGMTRVALVGYTNAGKSTVMNALLRYCAERRGKAAAENNPGLYTWRDFSGSPGQPQRGRPVTAGAGPAAESGNRKIPENKQVFEADMLFATLDTSVRRIDAPGNIPFLLSDTVGFVSDLPHSLVKAFRSTLDEVCCADLLLEVVDFSDPDYRRQIEVTAKTLEEIGAGHIPVVYLYNKTDLAMQTIPDNKGTESDPEALFAQKSRPIPGQIPFRRGDVLYLAAGKGIGISEILRLIDDALEEERVTADFLVPYKKGAVLQEIRSCGALLSEEYLPEGISVRARCRREDAVRISRLCRQK